MCATKDVLATAPTEYRMTDLQGLTYYSVELMAHNAIGFSHPSSIMLKTAQGKQSANVLGSLLYNYGSNSAATSNSSFYLLWNTMLLKLLCFVYVAFLFAN